MEELKGTVAKYKSSAVAIFRTLSLRTITATQSQQEDEHSGGSDVLRLQALNGFGPFDPGEVTKVRYAAVYRFRDVLLLPLGALARRSHRVEPRLTMIIATSITIGIVLQS